MMQCLLDTHAFLWTWGQSNRIPPEARKVVENPSNVVFLSAVSLWEIAIKLRSGRLEVGGRTAVELMSDAIEMNIQIIGLDPAEAASHSELTEDTHFDPFDRMLIWQAISRNLTLVSGDREFERFQPDGLKLLWR